MHYLKFVRPQSYCGHCASESNVLALQGFLKRGKSQAAVVHFQAWKQVVYSKTHSAADPQASVRASKLAVRPSCGTEETFRADWERQVVGKGGKGRPTSVHQVPSHFPAVPIFSSPQTFTSKVTNTIKQHIGQYFLTYGICASCSQIQYVNPNTALA